MPYVLTPLSVAANTFGGGEEHAGVRECVYEVGVIMLAMVQASSGLSTSDPKRFACPSEHTLATFHDAGQCVAYEDF